MGGLQQTTINCGKQNIKPEKSPLSTPASATDANASSFKSGNPPNGLAWERAPSKVAKKDAEELFLLVIILVYFH